MTEPNKAPKKPMFVLTRLKSPYKAQGKTFHYYFFRTCEKVTKIIEKKKKAGHDIEEVLLTIPFNSGIIATFKEIDVLCMFRNYLTIVNSAEYYTEYNLIEDIKSQWE